MSSAPGDRLVPALLVLTAALVAGACAGAAEQGADGALGAVSQDPLGAFVEPVAGPPVAEVRFRLARQPATGRGTLWMSMMVGGEHYALVDPAIELGPSATATPLTAAAAVFRVADGEAIEVAARDRQGDSSAG